MSQVKPSAASGSFVALVEDGIPKFAKNPVRHATNEAALKEANRLAAKYPGQLFQVFGPRVKAKIIVRPGEDAYTNLTAYVEPKPPGVSGKELISSAPEGVYRNLVRRFSDQSLFFVLVNDGNRCVMFQHSENSPLEALHPLNWNEDRFEQVKFPGIKVQLTAVKHKGGYF